MTPVILTLIIVIHYLADFALQTDEQAKLKSGNKYALAWHVGVYSAVWTAVTIPILGFYAFLFGAITFICHYATDYVTSKISRKFWLKEDYHNVFATVGFDQMLHYFQLYWTFKLLLSL